MKNSIVNRGDWFLVEIIERCEPVKSNRKNDLRRGMVWGNYHLIRAASPEKAFDKAKKLGMSGNYVFINADKIKMKWEYVGIGDVVPIYENIEDKAELMWTNYGLISARRSKQFVKAKRKFVKGTRKPSVRS